jgi:hypothetical protein
MNAPVPPAAPPQQSVPPPLERDKIYQLVLDLGNVDVREHALVVLRCGPAVGLWGRHG